MLSGEANAISRPAGFLIEKLTDKLTILSSGKILLEKLRNFFCYQKTFYFFLSNHTATPQTVAWIIRGKKK